MLLGCVDKANDFSGLVVVVVVVVAIDLVFVGLTGREANPSSTDSSW